jgi:hypothetical protein
MELKGGYAFSTATMIFLPPKSGSPLVGGAVVAAGVGVAAGAQAAARNDRITNRLTIRKTFILFSFLVFLKHGEIYIVSKLYNKNIFIHAVARHLRVGFRRSLLHY